MAMQIIPHVLEPAIDDKKPGSGMLSECSTTIPASPVSSGASPPRSVFDVRADVILGAGSDTFKVHSVLGEGAFGMVYKVTDKQTGRNYAMKVLDKERIFEEERLGLAVMEKNVQSSLTHPFIVSLMCAFQTDHELVLVMQFCPGGTLQKLVKDQGGLPEELSRLYFSEVFLAIEHIHSCEIAYRDLKCANVVLDDLGHAMLADFGLSKQNLTGRRRSNSFVGTPRFMSPEMVSRKSHGKEVDIYGLGVLLFEMLTGSPPFSAADVRDRQQLLYIILNAELEIPSFVSCDCASILRALLDRDPEQRLGAADTADIRGHPFLAPTDFDALLRREVPVKHSQPCLAGAPERENDNACECPDLPEPFSSRFTFASLLGATIVRGWEFPAPVPRSKLDSDVPASASLSRVQRRSRTWQSADLVPLSQMYLLS